MVLIRASFKLADLTLTPTPQLLLLNEALFMSCLETTSTSTTTLLLSTFRMSYFFNQSNNLLKSNKGIRYFNRLRLSRDNILAIPTIQDRVGETRILLDSITLCRKTHLIRHQYQSHIGAFSISALYDHLCLHPKSITISCGKSQIR